MKQHILGDEKSFVKKFNTNKIIVISTVIVALALNLLFTLLRTDQNHFAMLFANIAIDCVVGCFVIAFASFVLLPQKRLVELCKKPSATFRGEVVEISSQTIRMQNFDCYQVKFGKQSQRAFYLVDSAKIQLQVGQVLTVKTVSNVIVEVQE